MTCRKLITSLVLAATLAGVSMPAVAQTEAFTISFAYNRKASPEANYQTFLRKAERACLTSGVRPLAHSQRDQACVDDLMDKLVARMGRNQLALVHLERTGRSIVDSRTFAAR